jgi:hypothetical protein
MSKIIETEIEFDVDGEKVEFKIYNDLPTIRGLSIEDAVMNWIPRTRDYTPESLVDYIMDKNTGVVAMTEKQWKQSNTKTRL